MKTINFFLLSICLSLAGCGPAYIYNSKVERLQNYMQELKSNKKLSDIELQKASWIKTKELFPEYAQDGDRFLQILNQIEEKQLYCKRTVGIGQGRTAQDIFFEYLDSNMPDWEATNETRDFLKWVETVEPTTGKTFREILKEAQNTNDALTAAEVFEIYFLEKGKDAANKRLKGEEAKNLYRSCEALLKEINDYKLIVQDFWLHVSADVDNRQAHFINSMQNLSNAVNQYNYQQKQYYDDLNRSIRDNNIHCNTYNNGYGSYTSCY